MSFQTLRPQVKAVVDTISALQEVSAYPKIGFEGYPAAYVLPSTNSGDYETTTENIRTYGFLVRVFYETKHGGISNAFDALESIIDSLIDAFDEEDLKGSDTRLIGVNLPAKYTFINVWASPSFWGELPDQQLVMAEISVRIRLSVDVT